MPVHIGTSGWQYDHWRLRFYPESLAKSKWLQYYAERFQTVEVDSTFYRLPSAPIFERWRDTTPADFKLALKASRFLTHLKRLHEPAEPVHTLMARAQLLGEKLGPVLLQLPPTLRIDIKALGLVLEQFPPTARVAVEARHDSWYTESTAQCLQDHGAAWCLSDVAGWHPPLWRTASWGYLRFHRGTSGGSPCYPRRSLGRWAERIATLWKSHETVYAFFNNDAEACALHDARSFGKAIESTGLIPTRVDANEPGDRLPGLA